MRILMLMLVGLILAGCASRGARTMSQAGGGEDVAEEKEEGTEEEPETKVNIRFLYGFCNDVKEMQEFYTKQLGMKETAFMDEEGFGWLAYKVEGLELMFFRWDEELPVQEKWAWQPGETVEGAAPTMSFSIEFPMEKLINVVKTLTQKEVTAQVPKPTWRQDSYWGWTVKDPMGNTIELYATPKEKPEAEEPEWSDE